MDCQEVRDRLEAYALEGLPAPASAHLDACSECREAYEGYVELMERVRNAADPGIRHAFAMETRDVVLAEIRSIRRRRRVAVAAAVLLAGVAAWMLIAPEQPAAKERWNLGSAMTAPMSDAGAFVVRDRRLYFTGSDGTVEAIEAATGRSLWKSEHDWLGYLAADEARVYGLVRENGRLVELVALDAAGGGLLWRHAASGRMIPGPVSPPVPLEGNRVSWTDGRTLHLLEADTGRVVRERKISGEKRLSTPGKQGRNLYVTGDSALLCLDVDTGEILWSQEFGAGETTPEPPLLAVEERRCYVARPMRGRRSQIVCVDVKDRCILWIRSIPRADHLLAAGSSLFVRGLSVMALDGASGKTVWTRSAPGCGPLTADGDMLHLLDSKEGGRYVALDWRDGREIHSITGVRSCGAFVRQGGLGYLRTLDGILHAYVF